MLAGDNAIVVGMAAAGLPSDQRRQVIIIGIAGATVLRILFAAVTVQLLQIVGLVLAGGLLLLWVCWKLWREIEEQRKRGALAVEIGPQDALPARKSMRQAVVQIIVADLSMSLDNVLAVAGIAREHTWVLIIGLALSVAFMGLAAAMTARLLARHHWIAYVGLLIIFYVAMDMIVSGSVDIATVAALLAPPAIAHP